MQPAPSLLDWLKVQLGQPRIQRLFRYGLAALAALWGLRSLIENGRPEVGGLLLLLAGAGLFAWGMAVREAPPALAGGLRPEALPGLALGAGPSAAPGAAVETPWTTEQVLKRLRLPSAVLLAVLGQATLTYRPKSLAAGLLLYGFALAIFIGGVLYDRLLGEPRAEARPAGEVRLAFRGGLLALAAAAGLVAFISAGDNRFRPEGVLAWIVAALAWLAAVWEWPAGLDAAALRARWAALQARATGWLRADGLNLRLSRSLLLLGVVLAVGAYFRFARLAAIPPEMTSDHVEKLLDVNDILHGLRPVFFERNTGREPLQFYFAVLVIKLLGTGVTHLTLKITGAVAGFLLLPFIYLLGRELEDEAFALLATALAGISFWATAISRVGLRFPLTPLFVAPVLFYLLRGARRASRNDFLLAGLFLGAGLYGYSTFRVAPLLVAVAIAWLLLWPQPAASRKHLLANSVLLFATTFMVFLPLYRYATEPGNLFWYRSLSRLGSTEAPVAGSRLALFLQNNWNALRMFNWRGDVVWVNTIPGMPVLDIVTGALFVLGAAFLLLRLALRRDRVAGLLLLALPILLLPSTLSFAFPDENPSAVRTAGAIPVVMLMAAYPAWLLLRAARAAWPFPRGRRYGWLMAGGLLVVAGLISRELYFVRYPQQYLGSAQNASEIGEVVRGYAQSVGSLERVFMCEHPHWADTRAVGIYAGQVGWEQVLRAPEFATLRGDPRALLVVVNPRSDECRASLIENFPSGQFTQYHSRRGPDKDFLLFYVPGTGTLPQDDALAP